MAIKWSLAMTFEERWLRIDPEPAASYQSKEIEEDIVQELVKRHQSYIDVGLANVLAQS
jgi:hypothetical protein